MTNESIEATPRSVRDELQEAYKETTDFDTELFNAMFAALTMLEKQEARLAALFAAQSAPAPKVLYEDKPVLFLAKDNIQLAIEAIEDIRRQYLEVLRRDTCRTIQPGTNIINRLADAQKYLEELAEEKKGAIVTDQQKRQHNTLGRPICNPNLTGGRVQDRYTWGTPLDWTMEDILGNLRQLNREVDELKAEIAALKGD